MSQLKAQTLFESLTVIKDPRVERTKLHSLIDILVIAICAMICGAEDWEDMAEFGEAKQEWLATFLELKNGIPSHDTNRASVYFVGYRRVKGIVFRMDLLGGEFKRRQFGKY